MNTPQYSILTIGSIVVFLIGGFQLYRDNFSPYSFGYLFLIGGCFTLGAVFGYNCKEVEEEK